LSLPLALPVLTALSQKINTEIGFFPVVERLVVIGELIGEAESIDNSDLSFIIDENVTGSYIS
jgi:hypothetical protein